MLHAIETIDFLGDLISAQVRGSAARQTENLVSMGGIYAIWRQTSNKYAVADSLVSIRATDNDRRDRRMSIPVKLVTLERRSKITLDSRGASTQGATRTAF